jgi:hypothetical protein
LCYPCWTNWTKVVSTFDKVDKGVTILCGLRLMMTNSNWSLWWEFEEISKETLLRIKDYHIEDDEEYWGKKKKLWDMEKLRLELENNFDKEKRGYYSMIFFSYFLFPFNMKVWLCFQIIAKVIIIHICILSFIFNFYSCYERDLYV